MDANIVLGELFEAGWSDCPPSYEFANKYFMEAAQHVVLKYFMFPNISGPSKRVNKTWGSVLLRKRV